MSQMRDEPGDVHKVDRAITNDLVGDVDVATLGVLGLRLHDAADLISGADSSCTVPLRVGRLTPMGPLCVPTAGSGSLSLTLPRPTSGVVQGRPCSPRSDAGRPDRPRSMVRAQRPRGRCTSSW